MNWQTSMMPLAAMNIFVDKNCVTEKVTYRAVAIVVDVRRPNNVKPIYKVKRFVKRTPRAYKVEGMGIVMHPDIYNALIRKIGESVAEQERKLVLSALGIPTLAPPVPRGLTLADLEDAIKRFDNL